MPVQNVQLRRRHAIDLAFDILKRNEVASRVQQQTAPREARGILDTHPRQRGIFRAVLNKLEQGFHRPQRAKAGIGRDVYAVSIHGERVAFIAVGQRLRLHLFSHRDTNGGIIRLVGLRL